jgi:hypothetical protein
MLKPKLQTAVDDLKKVYAKVLVRPGSGEGQIDIAVEPSNLLGSNGEFAAFGILAAHGLQAHGHVASRQISKLFLRDITEVPPEAPSESNEN